MLTLPTPAALLTVTQLSQRYNVSVWTVYRLLKRGLPHLKLGRNKRFDAEQADRWLTAGGADPTRKLVRTRAKRAQPK